MGISREKLGDVKKYIGAAAGGVVHPILGFGRSGGNEAVRRYREYYSEKGWREVRVYDGMNKH